MTTVGYPRYAANPMRVLNTEQMREADRRTIEDIGLPSIVLMENAGRQVVSALEGDIAPVIKRQFHGFGGFGRGRWPKDPSFR